MGAAAAGQLQVQERCRGSCGRLEEPSLPGPLAGVPCASRQQGKHQGRQGRSSSRLPGRCGPSTCRAAPGAAGSPQGPGPSRRSLRAPLTATFRLRGPGGGGGWTSPLANRRSERRGAPRPSSRAAQSAPGLRAGGRDFRGRGGGFVCASAARSRLPAGGGAWGARPGPTPRAALGGGGGGGSPLPCRSGGPPQERRGPPEGAVVPAARPSGWSPGCRLRARGEGRAGGR